MTESPSMPEMTLAQQRVAGCPIKPCLGRDDNETLLRSVRSERLLCMGCATRMQTGYIGREEARQTENKFYKATTVDYAIQFAVCAAGTGIATGIATLIGFWLFVFFIGAAAGGAVGAAARQATGRRLGRYSGEISVAGVVLGALASPVLLLLLQRGLFRPQAAFNLTSLICAGVMSVAIYGLMKGRI